jgi:hypothetical protein
MIYKVIDYNGVTMNACTHPRVENAFQFDNGNNRAYFPYVVGGDPLGHWI